MSELTLTVEETAKVLGCSTDKVYEMAAQNKIPHVHLGKLIRVPRAALEKWLLDTALAEVYANTGPQNPQELLIALAERNTIKIGKKRNIKHVKTAKKIVMAESVHGIIRFPGEKR